MIVEDSSVVREMLRYLIGRDSRLEVAACVHSGEEALRLLGDVCPDVISLDIRLPGINGLETAQQIMATRPTPIVVVSGSVEAEDLHISMNALRAGALAVVQKPVGVSHRDYQLVADELCTQLALMSRVKVIRQRIDRGLRFGGHGKGLGARGKEIGVSSQGLGDADAQADGGASNTPADFACKGQTSASARSRRCAGIDGEPFTVLGIAASTGGPGALQTVLSGLGPDFPLPIVVVQHIADGFSAGLVSWLDGVVPCFRVKMAGDGESLKPGNVYVAPSGRHLQLVNQRLALNDGAMVSGQRPSATVLFQSMARSLGSAAIAALLTGMGDDGAIGLKAIHEAGGHTIAEDASTAVVFGMPRVAAQLGAVSEMLPLDKIGNRLRELIFSFKV